MSKVWLVPFQILFRHAAHATAPAHSKTFMKFATDLRYGQHTPHLKARKAYGVQPTGRQVNPSSIHEAMMKQIRAADRGARNRRIIRKERAVHFDVQDANGLTAPEHFKNTLLVVERAHFHATKLLEVYKLLFWDVLYIAPASSDAASFLTSGIAVDDCHEFFPDIGVWDFKTFPCLGRIIEHIMGTKPINPEPHWSSQLRKGGWENIKGVVAMHSDFWLHPSFGTAMDFSKAWILLRSDSKEPSSLETMEGCVRKGDPLLNSWNWAGHGGPPQEQIHELAMKDLKKKKNFATLDEDLYCAAWVDNYYLPRSSWNSWAEAVEVLSRHQIMNEVGVPLAFRAMATTGTSFQFLGDCWGSRTSDASEDDILKHACGHRMNLTSDAQRQALHRIWSKWNGETKKMTL